MSFSGYCPRCFASLAWEEEYCPHCHSDLTVWSRQSFPSRLIHALQHPLADVRIRAIIALGMLHLDEAAPALVACALHYPTDVTEGLAIVNALAQLIPETVGRAGLKQLASEHPAHAVRHAALEASGCQATLEVCE